MSFSNLNDIELLQLLQQDNEEAFAELYNRYWKRIYTQALSYTKSPEAAQDIVQDVFLKIWINRKNLHQVREFKPYLLVTARNFIISSLRNKILHVALDPEEQIAEEMLLPERQLSYKQSVGLLHKAINLLPPQQQKAYNLSRNERLRYDDIAREMGISPLTVRTHISKALDFIRKYMTNNDVSPVFLIFLLLCRK